MPASIKVILMERIDSLGKMGDLVKVRAGYARNFLLPQKKALRATESNIAYFEGQRAALEKVNAEKRKDAEKLVKKLEGAKAVLIRHAAEGGQLYGSVSTRDIADVVTAQTGVTVVRTQVILNQALKMIGLFPVTVALHPEVKVDVTINIARSEDEAKIQEKTGRALIATDERAAPAPAAAADDKTAFLEESALEIESEMSAEEAAEKAEKAEKAAKRAAKKSKKREETEEEADEE